MKIIASVCIVAFFIKPTVVIIISLASTYHAKKSKVLALKMTIFESTPLAEIPRFSDQNQKDSKNA